MVDVDLLVEHPMNPNKHGEKQIAMLAKIMNHQGWRHPITVSKRSGFIVAGHGRLMAARKLGWTSAPIDRQEFETEADEYAHLIADNKIAELAEHDDVMMFENLAKFPDMDLDLLGIPDLVIPGTEEVPPGDPDAVPELPSEAKTKLGDVYRLGNHRLMCGDSTSIDDLDRLMQNSRAAACITDPPYSVGYENQQRKIGQKTRKDKGDSYRDPEDAGQFLKDFFATVPSDLVVMTYPVDKHFHNLSDATREWDFLYECVWVKNHFAFIMGKRYQQKHEPIIIMRRKGGKSTFNVPPSQSTVFEYDKPSKNPDHPTPKPVELYEKFVEYHSNYGDVIFEPFGGSGTTLIACEKTGRIARVMELSTQYCDVIVKRWEDYTGKKAELIKAE